MTAIENIIFALSLAGAVFIGAVIRPAFGGPLTKTVSNTYLLGDNDSRADGRRACIADAKQQALEAIGTAVESDMVYRAADTGGIRHDDAERRVRSYVAGIVKVTVGMFTYGMDGDRLVIICSLDVTADPDEIRAKLQAIVFDGGSRKRLDEQQGQLERLQAEIKRLGIILDQNISVDAAAMARDRRTTAQKEAERLEGNRADIIRNLQAKTDAARHLRVGMTEAEVRAIAGDPRGIDKIFDVLVYNYGALWVTIDHDTVHCVSKISDWSCNNTSQLVQR